MTFGSREKGGGPMEHTAVVSTHLDTLELTTLLFKSDKNRISSLCCADGCMSGMTPTYSLAGRVLIWGMRNSFFFS
jgi:hypothetical protein